MILTLAAFGARILNMMDQNEEWDSDFTSQMAEIASEMGLDTEAQDGLFTLTDQCRNACLSLPVDASIDVRKRRPLTLTYEPPGDCHGLVKVTVDRNDRSGQTGVMLQLGKGEYEL